MRYYTIPPPESLKPFVRCFWVLEHDLGAHEPEYIYRSIADGCAEMVFHYQGAFDQLIKDEVVKSWRSGLHAQTDHYTRFLTRESFGIFGVYLYPYAIPLLFDISAGEASNQMPDMETLLGSEGRELEERMMQAPNNLARAGMLSNFLEKRLLKVSHTDQQIFTAIRQVIHADYKISVSSLADQYALSSRQFNRRFITYAGFNPKTYLRLNRLQAAVKQYGQYESLTQLALNCGYYDQSHFIHDFKRFTGYHPKFYFSGKAEGTEYRNAD